MAIAMTTTTTELAEARRDAGMCDAVNHAEADSPGWREVASAMLVRFASDRYGRQFLSEDFVEYTLACGLEEPPDRRAFGAIIKAAAKRGEIVKCGYGLSRSSNLSPKTLWTSTIGDAAEDI